MNAPEDTPLFVVTERPRQPTRSLASRVFSFVSSVVVVGLICGGVYFGVTSNKPYVVGGEGGAPGLVKVPPKPPRPITTDGGGKEPDPIETVIHERSLTEGSGDVVTASPNNQKAETHAQASDLVLASLKSAKQGMFTKANDLVEEARHICPDHPGATGAWYLAAYAEKYSNLADEALTRLNGANDSVDLGPKFGRGAFIERNEDEYTFRCRGKNTKFPLAKLNAMDGVRFGITRQFLDNADLPANHLILAGIHYLKDIDETGRYNHKSREKCVAAAVDRCERVTSREDDVAEHATHMLALFEWLGSQADEQESASR
jgi:hypothetical protein